MITYEEPPENYITLRAAGARKSRDPAGVRLAFLQGHINGIREGRRLYIKDDAKFRAWIPQSARPRGHSLHFIYPHPSQGDLRCIAQDRTRAVRTFQTLFGVDQVNPDLVREVPA